MGLLKALLFATLVYLVAAGDGGGFPPGPPGNDTSSTPHPPTSSSTTPSTPKTTTTTTTTTTPKPTTTTSTQKPTTTSSVTTSTPKPSPTTTGTPTTPKPATHTGKWVINYANTNNSCLIFEGAIDIDVKYKDGNVTKNATISVNSSALADGWCEPDETIKLTFDVSNKISFHFNKTKDSKYVIDGIVVVLNLTVPGEKDGKQLTLAHNESEFATPIANSYKCAKAKSLALTTQMKDASSGVLHLSSFQMQAFRNSSSTKFDEALDCESSETPDVVPIAVGCALAALVVIVLIAYLIGRRRSQARGYLSM